MPWKECHVMDERLRFVARLLDGEQMTTLCTEFGISRKTGYKIYDRYKAFGLHGLNDRSRRAQRQANRLPLAIERVILGLKKRYPSWGAPKIREKLRPQCAPIRCPAISTVHAVLDRHGLVRHRRRRPPRLTGTPLSRVTEPNALWCADFKGEFLLADHRYCYPLTITDFGSRYLLGCEALESTRELTAFPVFERVFHEFGLPAAIRTDNGVPFASAWALYGLRKLAVWWLRLGIRLERITPGHPEQNGRHERMHLTLKETATRPAAENVFQQQARFDDFVEEYNRERPHQALGMQTPADRYRPSARVYRGLEDLECPFHDWSAVVTHCGRICFKGRKINLSHVFAGQQVGIKQVDERIWLVSFTHYDLGYFDDETCRLEPIKNPFEPTVLPMRSE
ncbi:MAG TPA: IS481 family transposase [Vicinamibacterales bacterium]|nr:IS481 family transposase [Vicinamibacterales bacterium]